MKICIATLFNKGYNKIAEITTPNMSEYARKHGYDFLSSMKKYDDRPTAWQKIPLIYDLLGIYDWVVWLDTDCLIVDFSYKLEDFIDENYSLILGYSHQIETGVFFMKNTEASRQILEMTYNKTQFINDGAWEQTAMKHLLEESQDLNQLTKKIPMDPINLDPNFKNPPSIHPLARAPGMVKYWESKKPFIIHAGWGQEGNDRKYSILKHFLEKVKK